MLGELSNYDFVVVTSDEPWGDIWHTQLHYAFQLSKKFRVTYIDPPAPWKLSNLFNFNTEIKTVNSGLQVIRYKNILPSALGKFALAVNDFINEKIIRKNLAGFNAGSRLVIWHFDSFRSFYIFSRHRRAQHIYHVVDPIAGFRLDGKLAAESDLVVITSPKFLLHYQSLNKNVLQIGQGVDLDFFKKTYDPESLKKEISYNSILLLGTFSDEIDYRFLKLVASRYPGKLVLIGPDKTGASDKKEALDSLKSMPGVHWLGPMNPVAFHKHLAACSVGIISYSYSNYERNNLRSPLKVISYLACGKCIISNIDCEMPALSDKAIYIVDNDNAYFELIDAVYRNDLVFDKPAVQEFLDSIDYEKLLAAIFLKLNSKTS